MRALRLTLLLVPPLLALSVPSGATTAVEGRQAPLVDAAAGPGGPGSGSMEAAPGAARADEGGGVLEAGQRQDQAKQEQPWDQEEGWIGAAGPHQLRGLGAKFGGGGAGSGSLGL